MSRSKHAQRRSCGGPVPFEGEWQTCGRPLGDEFLCTECTSTLRKTLQDLPGQIMEVEDTAYRLDHIIAQGDGNSTKGKVRPLPFRPEVAALLDKVRGLVTTWARDTAEHRGLTDVKLPTSTAALCDWLANNVRSIALSPQAAQMAADFAQLRAELTEAVDLPAIPLYLGACDDCAQPMYARRDDHWHQCASCDRPAYNVERRLEQLLTGARNVVASPATIATALTSLDHPVTEERIWKWRQRGQLAMVKSDARGRPWYRVGDVLHLLELEKHKAAARAERVQSARSTLGASH